MAKPKKPSLTTKMQGGATVEGLNETLKALNRIDKAAKDAIKVEVQKIANVLAKEVTQAASRSRDRRTQFVGTTIRGAKDRVPVILVGKATKMPVSRPGVGPRASDLMFGMEFGANQQGRNGFRFPPRTARLGRGNEGYFIYPTLRQQQPRVLDLWIKALESVAEEWDKP